MAKSLLIVLTLLIFSLNLRAQNEVDQLTDFIGDGNVEAPIRDFTVYNGMIYTVNSSFLPVEGYGLLSMINPQTGEVASLLDTETNYRTGGGTPTFRGAFQEIDGMLFVDLQDDSQQGGLYLIEGSGATLLSQLPGRLISQLVDFQGTYYFLLEGVPFAGERFLELWQTDGTASGTSRHSIIPSLTEGNELTELWAGSDHLFISSGFGSLSEYLATDLTSDGLQYLTVEGSQAVGGAVANSFGSSPTFFFDGYYYFGYQDFGNGASVYRIEDGPGLLVEAEVVVGNVSPGMGAFSDLEFFTVGGDLYLRASTNSGGGGAISLYKIETDGDEVSSEQLLELSGDWFYSNTVVTDSSILLLAPADTDGPENATVYEYVPASESLSSVFSVILGLNANAGYHQMLISDEVVYLYDWQASPDAAYRYDLIDDTFLPEMPVSISYGSATLYEPLEQIGQEVYFIGFIETDGDFRRELLKVSAVQDEPQLVVDLGSPNLFGVSLIADFYQGNTILVATEENSDDLLFLYDEQSGETSGIPLPEGPSLRSVFGLQKDDLVLANFRNGFSTQTWIYNGSAFDPLFIEDENGEQNNVQLATLFRNPGGDPGWYDFEVTFPDVSLLIVDLEINGNLVSYDTLNTIPLAGFSLPLVRNTSDQLFAVLSSTSNPLPEGEIVTVRDLRGDSLLSVSLTEGDELVRLITENGVVTSRVFGDGINTTLTTAFRRYDASGNGVDLLISDDLPFGPIDGSNSEPAYYPIGSGERVIVEGVSQEFGEEFFVLDFEAGEISLLRDINPGIGNGTIPEIVRAEDLYYFVAITPEQGAELWRTDGSTDGTYLVADINPGSSFSQARNFFVYQDFLVFQAEGELGVELYRMRLDGSEEVAFVADINPDSGSSLPGNFTAFGEDLFFTARPSDDSPFQLFRLPIQLLPTRDQIRTDLLPLTFPNPVSNILTVEAPEGYRLLETELYDTQGRLIRSASQPAVRLDFDLSDQPSGHYWLMTRYETGEVSRRLVVKE